MKQFLKSIIAAVLVLPVFAQDTAPKSGSRLDEYLDADEPVSGIRIPYYDDDGNLQAQLYVGHAKMLENRTVEVTNLRIDVYQDGRVYVTIFAPKCFAQGIEKEGGKNILAAYSEGDVLLEMAEMTISGRGFKFTSEQNRFEILHDAKVLVKEGAEKMKGLGL